MPLLALLMIVIAVALLWQANRRQRAAGLPAGRVIYADTRRWSALQEPLYDRSLGLTGKPDYLVQQGSQFIPVEVKSSQIAGAPYDSHIFQLAAYCLLVESTYGERPPYGILHYPNRTFAVDYTYDLESALLELLEGIRAQERQKEVHRSHSSALRCSRCGYRGACDEVLH